MGEPFDLRVVPLAAVVAHEEADPHRVERLIGRLEADGRLANPPVVAAVDDHFVLLDGATRMAALEALGFAHAIVQVAAPDRLRLETWGHVILDIDPGRLVRVLDGVTDARLEDDGDPGAMCTLWLVDGRRFTVHPTGGRHPFTALNPLVAAYLGVSVIARTTEVELESAIADQPDAAALVVFPRLMLDTVFAAAREGHRLPAGITRFIVGDRVIALNAPLAPPAGRTVASPSTTSGSTTWSPPAGRGHIRHYPEGGVRRCDELDRAASAGEAEPALAARRSSKRDVDRRRRPAPARPKAETLRSRQAEQQRDLIDAEGQRRRGRRPSGADNTSKQGQRVRCHTACVGFWHGCSSGDNRSKAEQPVHARLGGRPAGAGRAG